MTLTKWRYITETETQTIVWINKWKVTPEVWHQLNNEKDPDKRRKIFNTLNADQYDYAAADQESNTTTRIIDPIEPNE